MLTVSASLVTAKRHMALKVEKHLNGQGPHSYNVDLNDIVWLCNRHSIFNIRVARLASCAVQLGG